MATSYLSPGVYIEEVDRGSKPIEAVGTSTCAFIGESSVGPTNETVLVTNWAQYTRTFGDFQHSTLLTPAAAAGAGAPAGAAGLPDSVAFFVSVSFFSAS